MKHMAEVIRGDGYAVYASVSSSPTGVWYHWGKSENSQPPKLQKLTRFVLYGNLYFEELIWKRGWRYLKGARKIARAKK